MALIPPRIPFIRGNINRGRGGFLVPPAIEPIGKGLRKGRKAPAGA